MPWSAADAPQHIAGLSARQRAVWAKVANAGLAGCLRSGGAADVCEGRALRAAAVAARRSPGKSIKVAPDGTLDILAVPFGGPFDGKDFDGEFFSDKTDLCLDWFPAERPLLYEHGLDGELSVAPIGRVDVTTARKSAEGWWVKAQLDKSSRYWAHVAALLAEEDDVLFASSGAMSHLVKTASDGELLRWPWVELSLTPTPANLFATVEPATARKHYQAAGISLADPHDGVDMLSDSASIPDVPGAVKAEWSAAFINDLPDSAFAVILPGGEKDDDGRTTPRSLRKLPHHGPDGAVDMAHLRNAMSREPQADMPDAAHATAHAHLMRHSKGAGMGKDADVSSTVATVSNADERWQRLSAMAAALDEDTESIDPLSALIHGKGLGLSFDDHADRVRGAVEELVERARSGSDLRLKEGRRISTARRERIASARDNLRTNGDTLRGHADSLHALADELEALLSETQPPVKAAAPPTVWAHLVDEFNATIAYYGLLPAEEK